VLPLAALQYPGHSTIYPARSLTNQNCFSPFPCFLLVELVYRSVVSVTLATPKWQQKKSANTSVNRGAASANTGCHPMKKRIGKRLEWDAEKFQRSIKKSMGVFIIS
jgi:hypothetical protein